MNFSALPRSAALHLRLSLLGLASEIALQTGEDAAALAEEYRAEAEALGGAGFDHLAWQAALDRWAGDDPRLPLVRLEQAGIEPLELAALLGAGLTGEDPRFAALLGNGRGATIGGLVALLRHAGGEDDPLAVTAAIGRLIALGLLRVVDPELPRALHELAVPDPVWDALSGQLQAPPGCRLTRPEALPRLADLILADAQQVRAVTLLGQMAGDPALLICLRGPAHNGRRTLAGALAGELDRPVIALDPGPLPGAEQWRQIGLIALLHDAVLLIEASAAPGEQFAVPHLPLGPVRIVVLAPASGSIDTAGRIAATLHLPAPARQVRAMLWQALLPALDPAAIDELSDAFLITSGTLCRAAAQAALIGDAAGPADAVRLALREVQDSRLEALASRIDIGGTAETLVLDELAEAEMAALTKRCRNREALAAYAGPGPGALGVRALLAGPSGTGKTLAARCLARALGRDLWRIDLAAAVNKYIGETEKALDRAFAAAEALDVVLLLDEGDALMARRTDVGNANDRYANLETNFLLQRIESYAGILVVTTNAAERIDTAFQRRMDVVVPFRAPDELRRFQILEQHLGAHEAGQELVEEVAVRCALSGGQLRNVALHARLLALDEGRAIGEADLRAAVQREYRKLEAHCPLKPLLSAVS